MKSKDKIFQLSSRQAGFSFMEVMLVVTIVGIMTSVGLVSLNESKNRKVLEMEVRKVGASLRQAQSYALTGKTGSHGIPCMFRWRTFIDNTVAGFPTDNISYWVRARKKADDGSCTAASSAALQDDEKYSLQNGVTFVGTTSTLIDFYVPFGTSGSGSVYEVTLMKNGYLAHVCVCGIGKIVEKEGNSYCDYSTDCL